MRPRATNLNSIDSVCSFLLPVSCRYHHGAPPERQQRPSRPGRQPTEGELGASPGLPRFQSRSHLADTSADSQQWEQPPSPGSAGTLTQGKVRATEQGTDKPAM